MAVYAKALFKRHSEDFRSFIIAENKKLEENNFGSLSPDATTAFAIIYSACIVAETIRNSIEDPEA